MKIKTVIIDDDFYAKENARVLIKQLESEIEIVGEADSVVSGIKIINKTKPDLVILDIEMPDGTAFDLLDCFEEYTFNVIFVSAFNHYAVKAFKYSSIAFIEKPFTVDEFKIAFEKVKRQKFEKEAYINLATNYKSQKPFKIELRTREGIYYIDVKDIMYIEADGRYSTFFINDNQKILIAKGIGEFEELLTEWDFFRSHQTFLINLNFVKKLLPADDGQIVMTNGANVTLSGKKREIFIEKMKKVTYTD